LAEAVFYQEFLFLDVALNFGVSGEGNNIFSEKFKNQI